MMNWILLFLLDGRASSGRAFWLDPKEAKQRHSAPIIPPNYYRSFNLIRIIYIYIMDVFMMCIIIYIYSFISYIGYIYTYVWLCLYYVCFMYVCMYIYMIGFDPSPHLDSGASGYLKPMLLPAKHMWGHVFQQRKKTHGDIVVSL